MGIISKALAAIDSGLSVVLKTVIRGYRFFLSPWLGNQCRFHPTCSHYALSAIEQYGALTGSWLAIRRLLRCHPWHPGGLDPVPEKLGKKQHG